MLSSKKKNHLLVSVWNFSKQKQKTKKKVVTKHTFFILTKHENKQSENFKAK